MLVFLDFHLSESIQYQIAEITDPEHEVITKFMNDNMVPQFEYARSDDDIITIYIQRFEILNDEKLNLYQTVFDFSNRTFTTFKVRSLIHLLLNQLIDQENISLIKKIFEYYLLHDSRFADDLKDIYIDVSGNLWSDIETLLEYRDFLRSWLDYINYLKVQKEIKYDKTWDLNLNGIIDQYLNVNPYFSESDNQKIMYYFFGKDNWLDQEKRTLQQLLTWNVLENNKHFAVIKHMKKMGYQTSYFTVIDNDI